MGCIIGLCTAMMKCRVLWSFLVSNLFCFFSWNNLNVFFFFSRNKNKTETPKKKKKLHSPFYLNLKNWLGTLNEKIIKLLPNQLKITQFLTRYIKTRGFDWKSHPWKRRKWLHGSDRKMSRNFYNLSLSWLCYSAVFSMWWRQKGNDLQLTLTSLSLQDAQS